MKAKLKKCREFERNRKVALVLSQWRGKDNKLMPQELSTPSMSLGAYLRQGLAVRSQWWGINVIRSWCLPLVVFQTVMDWRQWPSKSIWQFDGSAAFFLICNSKGKGVVRVNTRYRMYSAESQRKNMNCSSFRFRGQKSKFSYKHAELETVKVKKKKKEYSGLLTVHFVFFVLRKGNEKNLFVFFFFPFHCNTTWETLLNHDVPLMSFENSVT